MRVRVCVCQVPECGWVGCLGGYVHVCLFGRLFCVGLVELTIRMRPSVCVWVGDCNPGWVMWVGGWAVGFGCQYEGG